MNKGKTKSKSFWSNVVRLPKIESNLLRRILVGITLAGYGSLMVYFGPPAFLISIFLVQIKCFDEIINIAYNINKISQIPYFRTLHWYFVLAANYFFYGETLASHFDVYLNRSTLLYTLFAYHRFISFCWYFIGIVWFVLTLVVRKRVLRGQFSLLACTHFLLIIIVLQSHFCVENLFHGMIWVIMTVALVTLNDIFAYIFGRLIGKTPLIEVSPRKTREGFVYGALGTFLTGLGLAYLLAGQTRYVCPVQYIDTNDGVVMSLDCTPNYIFQLVDYEVGNTGFVIKMYPFVWHSLALSFFASIIAPFGGFCASGFKRAFNVKDFSDCIPGHGGIMDRFDCQYLMCTFVNVYIYSFVNFSNVDRVFNKIMYLDNDKQLEFYNLLKNELIRQQILPINV